MALAKIQAKWDEINSGISHLKLDKFSETDARATPQLDAFCSMAAIPTAPQQLLQLNMELQLLKESAGVRKKAVIRLLPIICWLL